MLYLIYKKTDLNKKKELLKKTKKIYIQSQLKTENKQPLQKRKERKLLRNKKIKKQLLH